ncbi:MAG: hypothetical protein JNN05_09995 [Candidatus Omnitrophica bacterium]|nr:hypothetical protein [Candidatus Omnitrophota bacterium]
MIINSKNQDVPSSHIIWLSFFAFLVTIQFAVPAGWIFHFFPAHSWLTNVIFPEWSFIVRPEHEISLYRWIVLMAIGIQIGIFAFFRKTIKRVDFLSGLKPFLIVEFSLTALILAALFEIAVYGERPELAETALLWLMIIAAANKIFWPSIRRLASLMGRLAINPSNASVIKPLASMSFVVLLIAMIYLPNPEACLARMFMGEQLHHYDSYIMAPGWAHMSGLRLNMDVISQYGVGMPIVLSELTRFFGGFSYLSVLHVLTVMMILYFIGSFIFLRQWLNSALLAMTGTLFALKIHMFHTGIFPFIFTLPSTTVSRYVFDLPVFFLLYYHIRTGNRVLPLLAAILCGIAIFYVTSTGMCLALALAAYITAHLLTEHLRPKVFNGIKDLRYLFFLAAAVVLSTLVCFLMAQGHSFFSKEFAYNMREFNQYFLSGFGTMPIYESLQEHNYLANLMGFVIPLVYAVTMTIVSAWIYRREVKDEHLMAVVISLYGLLMYHYYIARSAVTSYYVVAIPYVFICCYWLKIAAGQISVKAQRWVYTGLFILSFYALVTTHNFVTYPNLINVSRNPIVDSRLVHFVPKINVSYFGHVYHNASRLPAQLFTEQDEGLKTEKDFASDNELKSFYKEHFDFSKDVAMIDHFTGPNEKVALISSFETRILMQAKRKPFFYYFPLIISRPMKMHMFATSSLYTLDHYNKTIAQLDQQKPQYIFIERTFYLARYLPSNYPVVDGFVPLMSYVLSKYSAYAQNGGYLITLKRNDETPPKEGKP